MQPVLDQLKQTKCLFDGRPIISDWQGIGETKRKVRAKHAAHVKKIMSMMLSTQGDHNAGAPIIATINLTEGEEKILLEEDLRNEEFLRTHNASLVDGIHRQAAAKAAYDTKLKLKAKCDVFRYRPCVWYFNLEDEEQIAISNNANAIAQLALTESQADFFYFLRYVQYFSLTVLFYIFKNNHLGNNLEPFKKKWFQQK